MRNRRKSFFLPMLLAALFATVLPFANRTSALYFSEYFRFRVIMFDVSLSNFDTLAKDLTHRPSEFDWSTDYCSAPLVGSTGLTFDFKAACRRHDFGYRNLKSFGKSNDPALRREIDDQFLEDLRFSCSKRSLWQRPTCFAWSETFYRVVRLLGGP